MTPEERDLIAGLFDRLAMLESAPRDPEAERAIAEGLRQAPHAVYALVQTALIQDEALKRADARLRDLEAAHGNAAEPPRPTGFLDSMRESLFGKRETPPRAGSVPTVRPSDQSGTPEGFRAGEQPKASVWGNPGGGGYAAGGSGGYGTGGGGYAGGLPPGAPPPGSPGGSFLGTAAAAAAGMIGGSLMLDGIRSMMGHHGGSGHAFGGFDQASAASQGGSPWQGGGPGSAGGGDLARQAGVDDIGRAPASRDDAGESRRAGLFDGASDDQFQQQQVADDESYEDTGNHEDDDLGGDDGGDFGGGGDEE